MSRNAQEIRATAQTELDQEQERKLIDAEKQRLHAIAGRTWWQRVVAAIPFTITRKTP